MTKSRNILRARWPWTPAQVRKLCARYPHERAEDIARDIGCTKLQVYGKAKALGLQKSEEFRASEASGRIKQGRSLSPATQFRKGEPSWSKGTKGRVGVQEACRRTQFRKGERRGVAVKLYQPIGTERISNDGYLERKINDDLPLQARWRAVHLIRWEAIHGRIPPGYALVFRDGNKANTEPENMELISRAELMRRNTIHRYPTELRQVIRLNGRLKKLISEKTEETTP